MLFEDPYMEFYQCVEICIVSLIISILTCRIGSHRPIPKSKENQMTENLTVTSVMAVATKHISASNRLYQLQRNEPQSVSSTSVTSPVQAVIPPPTTNLRRRYSGDFQVWFYIDCYLSGTHSVTPGLNLSDCVLIPHLS